VTTLILGTPTVIFAAQSYTGQQSPITYAVPDAAVSLTLVAARSAWPTTNVGGGAAAHDVVSVLAETSYDGGSTWPHLIGFTAAGGNLLTPTGSAVTSSSVTASLPPGTGRQVRVSMNCYVAIDAQLSVTAH
jgi:hypothetical protein